MKYVIESKFSEELLKSFGKKDMSKLHEKVITDKLGHQRKVYVKNEEVKEGRKPAAAVDPSTITKGKTIVFKNSNGLLTHGEVIAKTDKTVTVKTGGIASVIPYEKIATSAEVKDANSKLRLFDTTLITNSKFRNGDNGMQPVTDIAEIYKLAASDHQNLVDNVTKMGKKFNLPENQIVTRVTLKKQARAEEKLMEDYNSAMKEVGFSDIYDPATKKFNAQSLRDVDGATLAFNSLKDLTECLKQYNVDPDIIRCKNNFAKPTPVHYSDINMNIRLPNGSVSEIQLNTVANIVAKETYGHALYEIYRSLGSDESTLELKNTMSKAQTELYDRAVKFSMEENFPDLNGSNPFAGVKNDEYAQIVKPYVERAAPLVEKAMQEGKIQQTAYDHFKHLASII